MRSLLFVVALTLAATAAIAGNGGAVAGGFGGALPDAQARWLCVQAMQNYLDGRGPQPPAFCDNAAPAAAPVYPPQPTRCTWIGSVYNRVLVCQ